MLPFIISADTGSDLPEAYCRTHEIPILPLPVTIDGVTHTDLEVREFYRNLRAGSMPTTSAANLEDTATMFRSVLSQGKDLLHIAFSSGLSSSAGTAFLAAEQLREEFPDRKLILVDTLSATQGQGILATVALMNRAAGMTIEENAAWLEEKKKYLCHRFMVGDLNYLHKGGRVSGAVAAVGTMLNIKPILIINDEGKLDVVAKARGEKAAVKMLVDGYKKEQGVPDVPKLVYIGHTSLYDKVEAVKKQVEAVVEPGTVVECINLGPIIGAHIGPSFYSVCGWGFHRREGE